MCRIMRGQGVEKYIPYASTRWITSGILVIIAIFGGQMGGRSERSPPEGSAKVINIVESLSEGGRHRESSASICCIIRCKACQGLVPQKVCNVCIVDRGF